MKQAKHAKERKRFYLLILLLLFGCSILFFGYNMIHIDILRKSTFENDLVYKASMHQKSIFRLNKILLFSSADATQNDTKNKAAWNLNVSQFCDIALFIDNSSQTGLTAENTIANLTIQNIQYIETPTLGTPKIYYKNPDDFGKISYTQEHEIQDSLSFEVVPYTQDLDKSKPQVYDSSFSPICFGFVNQNIKTNYDVTDIDTPLTYDGSLLKRCNVGLNSIRCVLSFTIQIENQLGQHFTCPVTIEIPLKENDDSTIYDGNLQLEQTTFTYSNFYVID